MDSTVYTKQNCGRWKRKSDILIVYHNPPDAVSGPNDVAHVHPPERLNNDPQIFSKPKFRLLTPWSTFILEKLTVSQLLTKFLAFYGIRCFIIASTLATTCPYPAPDELSRRHRISCKTHFNIIILPTLISFKWALSFRFTYSSGTLHEDPASHCHKRDLFL